METNLKGATLKKTIIHYVGSKNNLDALHLSNTSLALDNETLEIIGDRFLSKFSTAVEFYQFQHPSSLQYNEVYNYAAGLFLDKDSFEKSSIQIAKHLYESSTHPKVKGGELYVCLFEGLPVEGRIVSAVGLFKTENKSLFLEVEHSSQQLLVNMKEGVELNKVDKGCLIINGKRDEGFDV